MGMLKENDLIIGAKVLHGSPCYETPEIIVRIIPLTFSCEVEFESGVFTIIDNDDLLTFKKDGRVYYNDGNHGGMTNMISIA